MTALSAYVKKGVISRAKAIIDHYFIGTSDVTLGMIGASVSGATANAATGITASTTQTLAGGFPLVARINVVSTVANVGDAVTLPAMVPGQSVIVFNDGANPIKVFPNAATIAVDGGTVGASVTLTNAKRAQFYCISATVIKSAQLGVVSA